jgi:hypothetical protein
VHFQTLRLAQKLATNRQQGQKGMHEKLAKKKDNFMPHDFYLAQPNDDYTTISI